MKNNFEVPVVKGQLDILVYIPELNNIFVSTINNGKEVLVGLPILAVGMDAELQLSFRDIAFSIKDFLFVIGVKENKVRDLIIDQCLFWTDMVNEETSRKIYFVSVGADFEVPEFNRRTSIDDDIVSQTIKIMHLDDFAMVTSDKKLLEVLTKLRKLVDNNNNSPAKLTAELLKKM